jgi:hypothetical protein
MAEEESIESDSQMTLAVDGEVFAVNSAGRPGAYHYTWQSGPNEGYGFSSALSILRPLSREEHRRSIRDFLDQVDPRTGYIEDE